LENLIANIWEEVLGIEKIGAHHRFFDIGGNSVNILQVSAKLKDVLKRDIPMMVLFRYPSISALAAYLEEWSGSEASRMQPAKRLASDKAMMKQTLRKLGGVSAKRPESGSPQSNRND